MKKAPLLLLLFTLSYPIPGAIGDVIHYWRFEEGSGFTTADAAGGIDGALSGFNEFTGWSPSVPLGIVPLTGEANSYSLRFGIGFVNITTPLPMNLGTEFTIEFFFNPDQPVAASVFFSFGPPGLSYGLFESGGPNYFDGGFMADNVDAVPADFLTLNEWHHLALIKQPGQYSLYVDGLLIATQILSSDFDGPYLFPGDSPANATRRIGYQYSGWLDELRISDTALSPSEFLNIPEPGTLGLLALGGLAFWAANRHRRILPRCPP